MARKRTDKERDRIVVCLEEGQSQNWIAEERRLSSATRHGFERSEPRVLVLRWRSRVVRSGVAHDRWSGLQAYQARTAALATADGVENLLAIVVKGAQEHPPREAEEALALSVVGIVPASGCGVVEWVASPYTGVVHNVPPSCLWAVPPGCALTRGGVSITPVF